MIPDVVILVPYRDRKQHYEIFSQKMTYYTFPIYYIHQLDNKPFNRGAMKNIGFLMIKEMYPKDYKNITLVFNDIDSISPKPLDLQTESGIIKHFYGFNFTLGGIVSITAGDFEKLNGFPNLWSWGYEDNALNQRAKRNNITIDRSVFYKITDRNFIRLKEVNTREVNHDDYIAYKRNTEGIHNIKNLEYVIGKNRFVNVSNFSTGRDPNYNKYKIHDLKNGNIVFDKKMPMMFHK
jgi:hypothetical protein